MAAEKEIAEFVSETKKVIAALTPEKREKALELLARIEEALLRAAWHADRLVKAYAIIAEADKATKH